MCTIISIKNNNNNMKKEERIVCLSNLENNNNNNMVFCEYCHFVACKKCIKVYVSNKMEYSCMSCKKKWTFEFIISRLNISRL